MPRLILVAPTGLEYRTLRRALAAFSALPGPPAWEVQRCGIGPARARAFCARLEHEPRLAGLALLGWAGGLVAGLAAGDCVLADRALFAGCPAIPCHAPDLPALAGVWRGPVLTSARVLASPAARAAAAACGALAVEMEAYPLAAWAQAHELPFVHGRVILDAVEDVLPDLRSLPAGRRAGPAAAPFVGPGGLRYWVSALRKADRRLAALARAVAADWLAGAA